MGDPRKQVASEVRGPRAVIENEQARVVYIIFAQGCLAVEEGCDLILVEGDVQATAPRIEVWRRGVSEAPYAASDSAIIAVVSDDSPSGLSCPVWSRGNVGKIADSLRLMFPRTQDDLFRPS